MPSIHVYIEGSSTDNNLTPRALKIVFFSQKFPKHQNREMRWRALWNPSYDFLVRSMLTIDKNEGDFLGGPYFHLADRIMTPPPLKVAQSFELKEVSCSTFSGDIYSVKEPVCQSFGLIANFQPSDHQIFFMRKNSLRIIRKFHQKVKKLPKNLKKQVYPFKIKI